MSFTAEFKLVFLDDPRFLRAVEKAKKKNLNHQGAEVRKIARRSMRKRKGPAAPGLPPNAHSGELRKLLVYSWDQQSESVVVGPAWFNGSPVPAALEHGGTTMRTVRVKGGGRKRMPARIEPRPYINPAVDKAQARFPDIWRDSIVP